MRELINARYGALLTIPPDDGKPKPVAHVMLVTGRPGYEVQASGELEGKIITESFEFITSIEDLDNLCAVLGRARDRLASVDVSAPIPDSGAEPEPEKA